MPNGAQHWTVDEPHGINTQRSIQRRLADPHSLLVSYTDSESQSSQAGQTHVPAATQGVVTETKCPDGDNGDDGHAAMGEANATQLWVVS